MVILNELLSRRCIEGKYSVKEDVCVSEEERDVIVYEDVPVGWWSSSSGSGDTSSSSTSGGDSSGNYITNNITNEKMEDTVILKIILPTSLGLFSLSGKECSTFYYRFV